MFAKPCLLVSVLIIGATGPARAQEDDKLVRAGLSVGLDVGPSIGHHVKAGGDTDAGLAATFWFGWAVWNRVVIAGVSHAWTDLLWPKDGETASRFSTIGAEITFFFGPAGLSAGAGYAELRTESPVTSTTTVVTNPGWQFNGGVTVEPTTLLGFRLSVTLDMLRFASLRNDRPGVPEHPAALSLRVGLAKY